MEALISVLWAPLQVISFGAASALKSTGYEAIFDLGRGLRNLFRGSLQKDSRQEDFFRGAAQADVPSRS